MTNALPTLSSLTNATYIIGHVKLNSSQEMYLTDKTMVSIMLNTSGADLQHPSILIFFSLISGMRHRDHSLGIRPICHKPITIINSPKQKKMFKFHQNSQITPFKTKHIIQITKTSE